MLNIRSNGLKTGFIPLIFFEYTFLIKAFKRTKYQR